MTFILAIDQGTSSTKAVVVDSEGKIHGLVEIAVEVMTDTNGGVEANPQELLQSVITAGQQALAKCGNPKLSAVGLANQGETIVAWSRSTGIAQHNAIVWQDRRSVEICRSLNDRTAQVEQITGMQVDPYFVAPKIAWLAPRLKNAATDTVITTSDVWLLNQLCGSYSTDVSTASRTLLTDLNTLKWSDECAEIFGIDAVNLPAIHDNDAVLGSTTQFGGDIPVVGTCVDQQAALFAEGCHSIGEMKCTYGTGAFLLANSGKHPHRSNSGLTPCAAWRLDNETSWCLDGQVYTAGSAISWLIEIGVINSPEEIDSLCATVTDTNSVTFVPALAGLAAPWWQPTATGRIVGLTMSTTKAHLARATLVGIAAQVALLARAAARDLGVTTQVLKVDGGLTRSTSLLQIQADLAQCPVQPYPSPHATALGIAEMSLHSLGALDKQTHLSSIMKSQEPVMPNISLDQADSILASWSAVAEQSNREASL